MQNYLKTSEHYSTWIGEPEALHTSVSETLCGVEESAEITAQRLSGIPLKRFWPFNPEMIKLNQRLGILGITGEKMESDDNLKELVCKSLT